MSAVGPTLQRRPGKGSARTMSEPKRTGHPPRTGSEASSEQEPADAISEAFSEKAWNGHRARVLDEYDLPETPHPHAGAGGDA